MIADLIYGYVSLHSSYRGGDPVDALWIAAIGLFAIGAAAQESTASTPANQLVARPATRTSWAPYLAIGIGFAILVSSERHDSFMPAGVLVLGAVVLAALGSIRQYLAQRDLLRAQRQLAYQSLHDPLTGLPNRALLIDRATQMIARAHRHGTPISAVFLDHDGFKTVNDTYGHAAGDQLLQTVAGRLTETVREAETIGRLGGDEFVILLEGFNPNGGPQLVAKRVSAALCRPVVVAAAGKSVSTSVSIGIAFGERASADALLHDADVALYQAKRAGKGRWITFDSEIQTIVTQQPQRELDLAIT